MVGLKDIADAVGVSVGTVSRILNQGRAHLYSPDTCKRVLDASRTMGYRPNRSAQAMRLSKTHIVGFAAVSIGNDGSLQSPQVHSFVVGLSSELAKSGYHVAMVECSDMEDPGQPDQPWAVQERFLDALVVHYGFTDRASRFADNVGVPLIWWDSGVFEPYGCIYRDEVEVGRQLTRRLIESGHRRIGYLAGERGWHNYLAGAPAHYSYAQRYESYRDEMRAHGLREVALASYDPATVASQLKENGLTAVITQGSADALYPAAQLLNWRIPNELSVASLDREARLPARPRVAAMLYDRYELGERAARMVLLMLDKHRRSVPSVRYVGEFDPGDTMAPPRPA